MSLTSELNNAKLVNLTRFLIFKRVLVRNVKDRRNSFKMDLSAYLVNFLKKNYSIQLLENVILAIKRVILILQ